MKKFRFDWDRWNLTKSVTKHGISNTEAESIFNDPDRITFYNVSHSTPQEDRYICIGTSKLNRILFCYFTLRTGRIRIIGIRIANKKERNDYENHKG